MKKISKINLVFFFSLLFLINFVSSAEAINCSECAPDDEVCQGSCTYTVDPCSACAPDDEVCQSTCSSLGTGSDTDSSSQGSGSGGGSVSLKDPLGIKDPRVIIKNVINTMLGLVGSLALAVFIFGGFTWVISAGSEEKIKKGKDMVMWAALGLMLIFTSYALINIVLTAIAG